MTNSPKHHGAGEKMLALVDALGDVESAGVTELGDQLSLPKSTVHYQLDILERNGFVINEDGQYRLGLRFLELGEHTRSRIRLHDTAKSELEDLARETEELVVLMVEERGRGVYLHKAKGQNAIDIDAPIGRHASLHNRALGKAILAHLPDERVQEIIDRHGLPATTGQTITEPDVLFEELATIRDRGVSYNDQESLHGLRGVAVPILDENGGVLGAMSIAGPTARMKGSRFDEELPELLQRSRNIIELTIRNT